MNNLERFEAKHLAKKKAFQEQIEETVKALKAHTKVRRKTRVYQSAIDKHAKELFALHKAGCSISQLHIRLRQLGVSVNASTVYRWAAKHSLGKKRG